MAVTALTTIKNWFKTGLKPTQSQFWATWDSFWHKDEAIPAASISGLQTLLDGKADKKDIESTVNSAPYVPGQAYTYDALVPQYVSAPDSKGTNWYQLLADATPTDVPGQAPTIWKFIGPTLGDIMIEDVFGLRQELDALNDKIDNASSLTPEQIANIEAVPTLQKKVHRTISFNSLASIICRDYYKSSSSITEIILSGASAIEYSTDNITFTPITLPLAASLTVNGTVWWRITYANGQTSAVVTINGALNG